MDGKASSRSLKRVSKDRQLNTDVLRLLEVLDKRHGANVGDLLEERTKLEAAYSKGHVGQLEDTAHIREGKWHVDPLPAPWNERRVELFGTADRSALVNGWNSGAKAYVADLWNLCADDPACMLKDHRSISRAAQGVLSFIDSEGDRVRVRPGSSTRLVIAPRPMNSVDHSVRIGAQPVNAALLDLALFCANNAQHVLDRQGAIHLFLHDVHGVLEARWWDKVFCTIEDHLDLDRGTIRATVFIDSVAGAMQAEEILFELMHHSAGLSLNNAAYVADHVRLFTTVDGGAFPDRSSITLENGMLHAIARHVINVSHRRGAHALGTPGHAKADPESKRPSDALKEMLTDKEQEAILGMDGTLVGHSLSVNAVMAEFNKHMPLSDQMDVLFADGVPVADLIRRPDGDITHDGLVGVIRSALLGLAAMHTGRSRILWEDRYHDRASLRLAVMLLWHWVVTDKGAITTNGLDIHDDLLRFLIKKEAKKLMDRMPEIDSSTMDHASDRLLDLSLARTPPEAI